jgi:hypothetical protein
MHLFWVEDHDHRISWHKWNQPTWTVGKYQTNACLLIPICWVCKYTHFLSEKSFNFKVPCKLNTLLIIFPQHVDLKSVTHFIDLLFAVNLPLIVQCFILWFYFSPFGSSTFQQPTRIVCYTLWSIELVNNEQRKGWEVGLIFWGVSGSHKTWSKGDYTHGTFWPQFSVLTFSCFCKQ